LLGAWWNGRHDGLKIRWPIGCEGSSPSAPTLCFSISIILRKTYHFIFACVLLTKATHNNKSPGSRSTSSLSDPPFRIGYITQLWKDSKDIEFVKQTIGHRNLDTTSSYVNKLSDQERRNVSTDYEIPSRRPLNSLDLIFKAIQV
jgi:hypothetical protein